ncbi:helix-turn-helix domain-containing protein [Tropicimonas marinistellae]|uniref:helix-turn-helix domain-containing protein n=1 Tax=Tropicimonas marinistellae TaxID=1739787 RepID=UPI0013725757|nr:AraC family transcriptional regulator [Tropicimonas marinistellae]
MSIEGIEDLRDAVKGAGLQAVQLTRQAAIGSLVFRKSDGILYSSGRIGGRIALTGPLSEDMVTIGIGLRIAPGSRLWQQEICSGVVGVFHAGDVHEAQYLPGSLYATASMSMDHLEAEAAKVGLVLDARQLGGSGFKNVPPKIPNWNGLCVAMERVHSGETSATGLGRALLTYMIEEFARKPRIEAGPANIRGRARIVTLAREYIDAHLDEAISLDDIAAAAFTSHRTLLRAFQEILGQPPQVYIRTMRLHRMRQTLLETTRHDVSVTRAANSWGLDQLGRVSGQYKDIFGELPSQTLARTRPTRAIERAQIPG